MQTGYGALRTERATESSVAVSCDDYMYFVERAVRGMAAIVTELGDELSCVRPGLPGANTAYDLLTHCLGVVDYWGGHLVAGRRVRRDRAAEFDTTGTVTALAKRVDEALRRLRADVAGSSSYAALADEPDPAALGPERPMTQGVALVHVLLPVNPHNPTGEVFTTPELARVAELAERHDLIVISDEIHADLAHAPARHRPFAGLGPDIAARTVTVTSATKAFNIAGLRTAVAHVGPDALRNAWDALPPDLLGATNVLGVEATLAAWSQGEEWLAALNAHLLAQRDHLTERLGSIPGVSLRRPDAGYLAWLDLAEAGLPAEPAAWLREHAGVELSPAANSGRATSTAPA